MKIRVVSLILVLGMVTALFAGCDMTSEANEPNPFDGRFARFSGGNSTYVLVDEATRVCYLYYAPGSVGSMVVMLNADGLPVTLEEDK